MAGALPNSSTRSVRRASGFVQVSFPESDLPLGVTLDSGTQAHFLSKILNAGANWNHQQLNRQVHEPLCDSTLPASAEAPPSAF